eukprot:PITA_33018
MASSGKIEIKKFNGQIFELWKLNMEDLLLDKDQWIMVELGTKPTGVSNEEWKRLEQKAKSTIRLYVSYSILLNVLGEAMTKALWDKLGMLYQFKSLVNKLFPHKMRYNLRMKDGDSVTEHINAFNIVVPSLGNSMYYVSFIDDFSRNTWIYFLKKKSEVFDRFKEFKALVENQTEKKIKVLMADNGGEFCSKEFEEFRKKCGIARHKNTPYTPQ